MGLQVESKSVKPSDVRDEGKRSGKLLSSLFERRWWSYALAAGAGAMAAAPPAHAGIIYTPKDVYFTSGYVYIDLNNGGVNDFELTAGVDQTHYGGLVGGLSVFGLGKSNGAAVGAAGALALGSGAVIGHNGKFQGIAQMAFFCETYYDCTENVGKWKHAQNKFLGLVFDINGQPHYGWAELTVNSSLVNGQIQTTLLGYAYSTVANQAIRAGQTSSDAHTPAVPEPGTLGLLALGSAGLALWRRKREVAHDARN